ncbi:MAG TPA: helicase C-terminal domain-containing protein [Opitutaceae bacterium]|nr:helicase C-terminal domain-containing protein [Opitutaceae bacterium]
MQFSLDDRTCALSVGEFADFSLGPRDAGAGGGPGVWRAQLGQQWHTRLRAEAEAAVAAQPGASAAFEVPLTLDYVHQGWRLTFTGRIDQLVAAAGTMTVREIKTVGGPLPAATAALRADHPDYFVQALAYLVLLRVAPADLLPADVRAVRAELVFVEVGTGLAQTVPLTPEDEALFHVQLARLVEFLDLRRRARDRLRHLRFRPAFEVLREGQETIQAELCSAIGDWGLRIADCPSADRGAESPPQSAIRNQQSPILFEAPTGYGKTGVLLEFALGQLRAGRFSRLLYLTSKATGQLQVVRTLAAMTSPAIAPAPRTQNSEPSATPVTAWQVRPKAEHCVNEIFHCVRDVCPYLADLEARWAQSGLARFYLEEGRPRDLAALRTAGRDARLCPYEITRAALPFNDVWIGDYNYVFAPDSRGVFYERPGFRPAETLLVVDEAHNLPARVADAWSHVARAADAEGTLWDLQRVRPPAALLLAWERWARLLAALPHAERLTPEAETEVREAVAELAALVATTPLDYAEIGPRAAEALWETLSLRAWLAGDFTLPAADQSGQSPINDPQSPISTLLWSPRAGELHFTVLDAPGLIGPALRSFGGAILASATLQPVEAFAAACGLDDRGSGISDRGLAGGKSSLSPQSAIRDPRSQITTALGPLSRKDRRTLRAMTSGSVLLQAAEARDATRPRLLQARAPWRDHAYRMGVDVRVDSTFQHRAHHYPATAATVESLHAAAGRAVAVFFPSYAYADHILKALAAAGSPCRATLQPRAADLAAQTAWVEESLTGADALLLVLGSSFAESIDLLGGRVTHAMVVGPALPEVNAIQRHRLAALTRAGLDRDAAFRRVYQIPGMQKVNQALGRLVRAPGQHATILLHCRRFAEPSYAALLAPEYRDGAVLAADGELADWLGIDAPADGANC